MIVRHRRGVAIARICEESGVTHTILYKVLATVDPADRYPRIHPWTTDEDRVLIDHQDATAQVIADLTGRTRQAVKSRRSHLRKRGELPPA